MFGSHDEFKVVHRKKRKLRNLQVRKQKDGTIETHSNVSVQYTLSRLASLRSDMITSDFFENSVEKLRQCLYSLPDPDVRQLVCFGIGSFGSCLIAMHQLAFVLEVIVALKIVNIKFYDPVLTEAEKDILNRLGCGVINENCEGKYPVDCITVFYLPHCPKQLTNNLLWKNWKPELLKNVIIIGNSIENMKSNTPERFLRQDAEYVLRCSDWVTEVPLENNFQFDDVFNDTAIHVFCCDKLEEVSQQEWSDNAEPKYGDTELITAQLEENLNIR